MSGLIASYTTFFRSNASFSGVLAPIELNIEFVEVLALNSTISGSISSLCLFWGIEAEEAGLPILLLLIPFLVVGFFAAILGLLILNGVGEASSSDRASLLSIELDSSIGVFAVLFKDSSSFDS